MSVFNTIFKIKSKLPQKDEYVQWHVTELLPPEGTLGKNPEWNRLFYDYNWTPSEIASILKSKKEWYDLVINIHSLGSSSGGGEMSNTIGVLTNKRLPKEALDTIQEHFKILLLNPDLEKRYSGRHSHKRLIYKTKEYELRQPYLLWSENPDIDSLCDCPSLVNKKTPIKDFPIPPLTKAVDTGIYSDGWNNALHTQDARDWVTRQGVDLEKSENAISICSDECIALTSHRSSHCIGFHQEWAKR